MDNGWNHNIQYHRVVLRAMPVPCLRALDVGCGRGLLTRRLASKCSEVIGIDIESSVLNAPSVDLTQPSLHFLSGDVLTWPFPPASFDFIAAVATLHHLPLATALARFHDLLTPGGVLCVIGLNRPRSVSDYALAAIALPISWIMRHLRTSPKIGAPILEPRETLAEIRRAAETLLPGARIRRRFFFRYSLVWCKPRSS